MGKEKVKERLAKIIIDRKLASFKSCCEILKSEHASTIRFNALPGELQSIFDTLLKDNGHKRTLLIFKQYKELLESANLFSETYDPTINFHLAAHCQVVDELILVGINTAFSLLEMACQRKDHEVMTGLIPDWIYFVYMRCCLYIRKAVFHFHEEKKVQQVKALFVNAITQIDQFYLSIRVMCQKYHTVLHFTRFNPIMLERKKALILRCLNFMGEPVDPMLKQIEDALEGISLDYYHRDLQALNDAILPGDNPDVKIRIEDAKVLDASKILRTKGEFAQALQVCEPIYQRVLTEEGNQQDDLVWLSTCLVITTELANLVALVADKLEKKQREFTEPDFILATKAATMIDKLVLAMPPEEAHMRLMTYLQTNTQAKLTDISHLYNEWMTVEKNRKWVEEYKAEAQAKVPRKQPEQLPEKFNQFITRVKNFNFILDEFPVLLQRGKELECLGAEFLSYKKTLQKGSFQSAIRRFWSLFNSLDKDWHALCHLKLQEFRKTALERLTKFMQDNPKVLSLHTRLMEVAKSNSVDAQVYFSGGLVRDIVLGNNHFNDLDLKANFNLNITLEPFKGVIKNLHICPTAGFLWEGYSVDVTQFTGDIEEYAKRCDATINGMFYNPVIGLVADDAILKDCLLRRLRSPDPSVLNNHDDQVMRILYYASKLNLKIEECTAKQIKTIGERATKNIQKFSLSRMRLSYELNKAVLHGHATFYFQLLHDHNLVFCFFPFLAQLPNYSVMKIEIEKGLQALDRQIDQGIGLVLPEDFYNVLLRPYVSHLVQTRQNVALENLVAEAVILLRERIALQMTPYDVSHSLFHQLNQYFTYQDALGADSAPIEEYESAVGMRRS